MVFRESKDIIRSTGVMSNEDDVKEATMALKGILGIGGSGPSASSNNYDDNERTIGTSGSSKKKKKPKKKKQPVTDKEQPIQQEEKERRPTRRSKSPQRKVKKKEKNSKKSPNANTNSRENFAWSAFQSPPDASTLPLPIFSSFSDLQHQDHDNVDNGSGNKAVTIVSEDTSNKTSLDIKIMDDAKIIGESEAAEMGGISSFVTSESHIKALLNISTDNQNKSKENSSKKDEGYSRKIGSTNSNASNDQNKQQKKKTHSSDDALPVSSSGVNLAALATSLPSTEQKESSVTQSRQETTKSPASDDTVETEHKKKRQTQTQPKQELDPIAMLMNGKSYGTANPAMAAVPMSPLTTAPLAPHPQILPHQPYSGYPIHQQQPQKQQQQQQTPHHHPNIYNHHPMMQHMHAVPYFTIQVQVPPVLLPGRQMMVPASPMTGGFSFPVIVPEGVQPGMLLPVTIPNRASNGMLMQPQYQQQQQHGGYQNGGFIAAPDHHLHLNQQQQQQQQFVSSQRQQKSKRHDPPPDTWAARAAASQPLPRKKTVSSSSSNKTGAKK